MSCVHECKRSLAPIKNHPFNFLYVISKLFVAIINKKVVDHYDRNKLLSDKLYVFSLLVPIVGFLYRFKRYLPCSIIKRFWSDQESIIAALSVQHRNSSKAFTPPWIIFLLATIIQQRKQSYSVAITLANV